MKRFHPLLWTILVVAGCSTPPLPTGVTVVPDPVDFGEVFVGDTKAMSATLVNGSANAVNVKGSSLGPGAIFAVGGAPPGLPAPLAIAGRLAFPFTFTPPSVGSHTGTWHLTLDRRPYAIELEGVGVLFSSEGGLLFLAGASKATGLDFGDVVVGQTKELDFKVRNSSITGVAVTFPAAPAVAPAGPFTVRAPGAATTIAAPPNPSMVKVFVVFAPREAGHFTGTLIWTDGTGTQRVKCFVQGNGIAAE
jgi:hypothetical protein